MGEQPCNLVIEHQKILGELASDVKHIKGKVDNGLSAKLATVNETLVKFMATSIADRRVDKAENWFGNTTRKRNENYWSCCCYSYGKRINK